MIILGHSGYHKIAMRDPFGLFEETISISYALLLMEITTERGINAQEVLENTGLSLVGLSQVIAKMSPLQWSKLVLNAIRLTGDQRLGIEYGSRLRPTSHGALGFAFLSCADIETALNLCQTYFCTRIQSFTPSWHADEQFIYVYLDHIHPIRLGDEQSSTQLRRFIVECQIYGAIHFLDVIIGDQKFDCEVFVDWPQTEDYVTENTSIIKVYFNHSRNGFRIPKQYLKYKNPQADMVAFQQAIVYCDNDKAKVIGDGSRDIQKSIRAELIYNAVHGYPTFAMIASRLNMSERTLKRHLQLQGSSFSAILNDVRFSEAKRLLLQKQYDIQDIAGLVGYNEATNFIRAFKKQFGITPSEYRKSKAANSEHLLIQ